MVLNKIKTLNIRSLLQDVAISYHQMLFDFEQSYVIHNPPRVLLQLHPELLSTTYHCSKRQNTHCQVRSSV